MVRGLSIRLADILLSKSVIENKDKEIYEYGIDVLLTTVLNVIGIVLLAVVFNVVVQVLLYLLFFGILRTYAGGYHAKTHIGCFMTFVLIMYPQLLLIKLIPSDFYLLIIILSCLISVCAVICLAPVETEAKPLSVQVRNKCRKYSCIIVSIEVVVVFCLYFLNNHLAIFSLSAALAMTTASMSLVASALMNIIKREV